MGLKKRSWKNIIMNDYTGDQFTSKLKSAKALFPF